MYIYVCKIVACEGIRFSSALVSPAEKNGGREATTGNTSVVRRLVKLFHEISNFELSCSSMGKALDKSAQIRCLEKLYAFRANYQE